MDISSYLFSIFYSFFGLSMNEINLKIKGDELRGEKINSIGKSDYC